MGDPGAPDRFAVLLKIKTTYGTWGGTTSATLCAPPAEMLPTETKGQFSRAALVTCTFCSGQYRIGQFSTEHLQEHRHTQRRYAAFWRIGSIVLALTACFLVYSAFADPQRTAVKCLGIAASFSLSLFCLRTYYEDYVRKTVYGIQEVAAGVNPCSHSFNTVRTLDDPRIRK